jgi:hypothetical protein
MGGTKTIFKIIAIPSIVILGIVSILGSAQTINPTIRTKFEPEVVNYKNYNIGKKLAAHVGQPIAKVKHFVIEKYTGKFMRANEDFRMNAGSIQFAGDSDTSYPIRGETILDNSNLTVISMPGSLQNANFGILINKDGNVHHKILNNNVVMIYKLEYSPSNLKFSPVIEKKINKDKPYLNYELIYGGTDGDSFTVTYREFTEEDIARPSFYQNLVFNTSQSSFRFRDTVIQAHSISNERIIFTVISDGLPF